MGHDWIIGVLTDLRSFARKNELPLLSEQLEEAALVASVEIASIKDAAPQPAALDPPVILRARANRDPGHNA